MINVSLLESQALTSLRTFIMSVLPGVPVIKGQVNRTPEPGAADFVIQTATIRGRLETNTDVFKDLAYTGSAAGGTLTVAAFQLGGTIGVGNLVLGSGVLVGTVITGTLGGTGGTGTYAITPAQVFPLQQLAGGTMSITAPMKLTVQVDVHGPNAGDNAQVLATLFRDEYATAAFASYGPDVTPLYADDPKQLGFIDGEKQIEERWSLDVHLQINPTTVVPQQAAAALSMPPRLGNTFPL